MTSQAEQTRKRRLHSDDATHTAKLIHIHLGAAAASVLLMLLAVAAAAWIGRRGVLVMCAMLQRACAAPKRREPGPEQQALMCVLFQYADLWKLGRPKASVFCGQLVWYEHCAVVVEQLKTRAGMTCKNQI